MSSFTRFALPLLAAATTVFAQCSDSATRTIENAQDATAIAECQTFSGNLAIATGVAGDIAMNNIQKITGNLVISANTGLKSLGADSLEEIEGEFRLDDIQNLVAANFPKLKTVDSLRLNALPNLQNLGFDAEITKAKSISVENTQLQSLKGINIETTEKILIANNIYLEEIEMQLSDISNALDISNNNLGVNVSFPNLENAFNLTFRNCSSVKVPSLASLNGSLGLYSNGFSEFSAPNLTEIGGALALVSNEQLSNLTFPKLTEVKFNLQIANNTKLDEVNGLPQLKTVGGALDMYGNMSKVETPKLADVKGAFNLQSTGDVTEACNGYKSMKDKKAIKGKYFCEGKVETPGGEGTGSAGKNNDDKEGAASSLNVQNGALALAAMAAVFLI
ncbi:hypothetical protein BDV95DRAFT_570058 [Massariosphaeria phaeospora]|uniref:GPI-anchored cell wall organization protein Ecm33 n=1 Tax=Massariosphaeria phaeospora TaxID=100035 RepID=A0A7C8M9N3_9PLEO|nr:hypothetical protein BDV95DRAFT_570058 [Massariosphaeria phaeospora]